MRLAVCSGLFDPPTNGHLWLIDQARHHFDRVLVVLNSHPYVKSLFTPQERKSMLRAETKVNCEVNEGEELLEFLGRVAPEDSITLIRGVRKWEDYLYEKATYESLMRQATSDKVHFLLLQAPLYLQNVSSTMVKKAAESGNWTHVRNVVPHRVLRRLREQYPVATVTEAQEFDAPLDEHGMAFYRLFHTFDWRRHGYVPVPELEAARHTMGRWIESHIVHFADIISQDQVKKILDTYPVEVAVSEWYELRDISTSSVKAGDRHVACSRTFTPIVVDVNVNPAWKHLGPTIVIDGKHRLLDALERGEKTIKAYIGCKALSVLAI